MRAILRSAAPIIRSVVHKLAHSPSQTPFQGGITFESLHKKLTNFNTRDISNASCSMGSEQPTTRVAVGQMTSVDCVEQNYKTCATLAEAAVAQGAGILFLPENFNFLGRSSAESLAIAEPLDGPLIRRYACLAQRLGLWLSLGGFQERGPDPEHLYNCHVVINSNGEIAATYRKVHLFNVDVPGGPVLMESRFTSPGRYLETCDSPAGRLGLTICYDLRFPEMYQRLTFDLGAEILLVPSAFTVATGKAHWECLLRARAIETQCYVVAAAQAGQHNEKRESYGHSIVVDPWGRVVAKLSDPHETGVAVVDIEDIEEKVGFYNND